MDGMDMTPEEMEWDREYAAGVTFTWAYCVAGLGLVFFCSLRNFALFVDDALSKRAARARRSALSPDSPQPPPHNRSALATLIARIDNRIHAPCGYWGVASHWSVFQFWMVFIIVLFNVIGCLEGSMWPKLGNTRLEWFAIKTGMVATANFPFIYALAGRNNIIGFFSGASYQSLRCYHKLLGLLCFIESFLHTIFYVGYYASDPTLGQARWDYIWNYPNGYIKWGAVAVVAAFVMVVTGWQPIRSRMYELFLILHFIGALLFLLGAYYHWEDMMYNYIYAAGAVWVFERLCRLARLVYTRLGLHSAVVTGEARLVHGAIKLRVPFREGSWEAGQHFYLSFWGFNLAPKSWMYGQSHPFSASNSSGDGVTHVEFVLRVHGGLTRTLVTFINERRILGPTVPLTMSIEGPYGSRPKTERFESLLLVAGGSGITHPASVLSDLARRTPEEGSRLKEVKLVWAVHHLHQTRWIGETLCEVRAWADRIKVALTIDLYITRDDTYPASSNSSPLADAKASSSEQVDTPDHTPDNEKKELLGLPAKGSEELGRATLHYVRPDSRAIVRETIEKAEGHVLILACGPAGMSRDARSAGAAYARVGDEVVIESFVG